MSIKHLKLILVVLLTISSVISKAQSLNNNKANEYTSQNADYPYNKGIEYYKQKKFALAAQYFRVSVIMNPNDYDAYYLLYAISKKYNYQEESCMFLKFAMKNNDSVRSNSYNMNCKDYKLDSVNKYYIGKESIFRVDSVPLTRNVRGLDENIEEHLTSKYDRYLKELRDYYIPTLKQVAYYTVYVIINEEGKIDDLFFLDGNMIHNYRTELISKFNERLKCRPAKKNGIDFPITYAGFVYIGFTDVNWKCYMK